MHFFHNVLIFFVGLETCKSSVIQFKNSGYSNILVAIHNDVAEDQRILNNAQALLTRAPVGLSIASKRMIYFHDITIAIPESWRNHEASKIASSNIFDQAHIRIANDNEYFGPELFTRHFRGCGKQGEFIHLNSKYLQNVSKFSLPDLMFHNEWIRFRYGIFDKHLAIGTKKFSVFNEDWETAIDLCTERERNSKVLTKNIKCNYRNAMEVLFSHQDFRQNLREICRFSVSDYNRIADYIEHGTMKPKFTVIRQSSSAGSLVLVLDNSQNMDAVPIDLMNEALSRFILDEVPDETLLGVVSFNSEAYISRGLTAVSNISRKSLVDSLPTTANVWNVSIGKGLLKAIEVVEEGNLNMEGSVFLLIVGGEETTKPFLNDSRVLQKIIDMKIVVKTIAFGVKAAKRLGVFTSSVGGQEFFFKATKDPNADTSPLDSAFMEAWSFQADAPFRPVLIFSGSLVIQKVTNGGTFSVFVDDSLGRNTIFTILCRRIELIEAVVISPMGKKYTSASPNYNLNDNLRRIRFNFTETEVGEWHVSLTRNGTAVVKMSLSVHSQPKTSSSQPVRIKSYIGTTIVRWPNPVEIYTVVSKNNLPVGAVLVNAIIMTPKGNARTVLLKDNGKGADFSMNDGIYSGYFTEFDSKGRYSVYTQVKGNRRSRVLRRKKTSTAYQKRKRAVDEEYDIYEEERIGSFERAAHVGSFSVDNFTSNDVIPPVRITDLEVLNVEVTNDKRMVTIQWTSPGDDADRGNASFIEMRVSTNFSKLHSNFDLGISINSSLVMKGSLRPIAANQVQVVTLQFPESFFQYHDSDNVSKVIHISLRAGDEAGNVAEVSNLVSAYFPDFSLVEELMDEFHEDNTILISALCSTIFCIAAVIILVLIRRKLRRVVP